MFLVATAFNKKGNIRTKNQDNIVFNKKNLPLGFDQLSQYWEENVDFSKEPVVFAVFDGMGGMQHGEVASYLAAITAKEYASQLIDLDFNQLEESLYDVVLETNNKICLENVKMNTKSGTTAAYLMFFNNRVFICNIGDSPILLLRNDELKYLSEEHTERIQRELLFGKEMVVKKKYPLTQYLGIPEDEFLIEPFLDSIDVNYGDRFIICTDGLTDLVKDEEIKNIMSKNTNLKFKGEELLKIVFERGGIDNTSFILFEIKDGEII